MATAPAAKGIELICDSFKLRIRVNVIGLSAEMKICRDIATSTKGAFAVAEAHLVA